MRYIKWFFISIISLFTIAIITIDFWLSSEYGNKKINNLLQQEISKKLDLDIEIKGLRINSLQNYNIEKIIISDKNNLVSELNNVIIEMNLLYLMLGDFYFDKLSITEINIASLPNINIKDKSDDKAPIAIMPNIILEDLSVDKLIISEEISSIKNGLEFRILGSLSIKESLKNMYASLSMISLNPDDAYLKDSQIFINSKYDFVTKILKINEIEIGNKRASAKGNLQLDFINDSFTGDMNFYSKITDNDQASEDFTGKIILYGYLNDLNIRIKSKLDFDNLNHQLQPLYFSSNLNLKDKNLMGKVHLSLDGIDGNGNLLCNDKYCELKDFKVLEDNLDVFAEIKKDFNSPFFSGNLKARAKNPKILNDLVSFATLDEFDIDAKFDNNKNNQKAKLEFNLNNSKIFQTKVGKISAIFESSSLFENIWPKLDINLVNTAYDNIELPLIKLKGDCDNSNLKLNINSISSSPVSSNLSARSLFKLDNQGNINLLINKLSGEIENFTINSDEAIDIIYGKNISIKVPKISLGQGTLFGNMQIIDTKLTGDLEIDKLPLMILNKNISDNFNKAKLNSKFLLSGNINRPNMKLSSRISDVKFSENHKSGSIVIDNKYDTDKILYSTILLKRSDLDLMHLRSKVPLDLNLKDFGIKIIEDQEFELEIKPLTNQEFFSFLPILSGNKFHGKIIGEGLKIKGNKNKINSTGNLRLEDLRYENRKYGIYIAKINAEILGGQNRLIIKKINAEDEFKNKISGVGRISLNDDIDYKLNLETKKFSPANNPFITGSIAANLAISGNRNNVIISGDVDTLKMEATIPTNIKQSIPELDIIGEDDVTAPIIYPINLDLKINTKSNLRLLGLGIDANLNGKLKIIGEAENPIINGKLKIISGKYQEFGKSLNIKNSEINFYGPLDPSPYLNVIGHTNAGDHLIKIILSGSAFKPELKITSEPQTSQEEALSILLFGKGSKNISIFQGFQLASSVRKLSGKGGNLDPFTKPQKALGIDQINISKDPDNPENSRIGIGKYINNRVYIELENGSSGTETKIEVQLSPKLFFESRTRPEGKSSLGINWQIDY